MWLFVLIKLGGKSILSGCDAAEMQVQAFEKHCREHPQEHMPQRRKAGIPGSLSTHKELDGINMTNRGAWDVAHLEACPA